MSDVPLTAKQQALLNEIASRFLRSADCTVRALADALGWPVYEVKLGLAELTRLGLVQRGTGAPS